MSELYLSSVWAQCWIDRSDAAVAALWPRVDVGVRASVRCAMEPAGARRLRGGWHAGRRGRRGRSGWRGWRDQALDRKGNHTVAKLIGTVTSALRRAGVNTRARVLHDVAAQTIGQPHVVCHPLVKRSCMAAAVHGRRGGGVEPLGLVDHRWRWRRWRRIVAAETVLVGRARAPAVHVLAKFSFALGREEGVRCRGARLPKGGCGGFFS